MQIQIGNSDDLIFELSEQAIKDVNPKDRSQLSELAQYFRDCVSNGLTELDPEEKQAVVHSVDNGKFRFLDSNGAVLLAPAPTEETAPQRVARELGVDVSMADSELVDKVARLVDLYDHINDKIKEADALEGELKAYSLDTLTQELSDAIESRRSRLQEEFDRIKQAKEQEIERLKQEIARLEEVKAEGDQYLDNQQQWVTNHCYNRLTGTAINKEEQDGD